MKLALVGRIVISGTMAGNFLLGTIAQSFAENPIERINRTVVQVICRGDTSWLRCFKQDPFSCQQLVTPVVERCVRDNYTMKISRTTKKRDIQPMAIKANYCIKNELSDALEKDRIDSLECKNIHF